MLHAKGNLQSRSSRVLALVVLDTVIKKGKGNRPDPYSRSRFRQVQGV